MCYYNGRGKFKIFGIIRKGVGKKQAFLGKRALKCTKDAITRASECLGRVCLDPNVCPQIQCVEVLSVPKRHISRSVKGVRREFVWRGGHHHCLVMEGFFSLL